MAVFTALSVAVAAYSGGASLFAAAGVWLASAGLAGQLLVSLGVNALLGALSPKPAKPAARGYETNVLGAALDHTVIYGKTKVGGVVVYNESTGTDNKFLHRIIAVAGHEVESFERIYIDDAYIDFSDLGTLGNVSTVVDPDGTTSDRYNDKLRIQVAYGTPTQAANNALVTASDGKWTNTHKLSGIAYIYVRLAFDADVYPNGIPTFTAVVKGKKVFDPRTNTTGWSDNPALCVRDYLTNTGYGLGEVTDNIDDGLVMAAADVCDEIVFSQARYTTNGSFTTGATPYDLLSTILTSMGGSLWYAQGKWRLKPAYWTTPVMFLDEDDLRSSIGVSTRHSRRDNFNVIKGKFSGPDTNWQMVDYKEVRNRSDAGTFVTGLPYSISELGNTNWFAVGANLAAEVGDVFTATGAGTGTGVADLNLGVDNGLTSVADVDLLFTDNMKEARRLGRITLERNRQQLTVQASFGLKTLGLQVGDNVYITNSRFGWVNKSFEVLSWSFGLADDLDLQTNMTLRETAEAAFDEVDDAEIYEIDNTNLPSPFFVPVPSLDAAVITTTINEDGTAVPAIDFSWGVSNSEVVDYYDFQWKLTGASNYSSIATEEPRFTLAPALSNVAYDYRVRAVNTLGIKSAFASSPSPAVTGNDTTIPTAPTGLVADAGYGAVTVTWNRPTTNVGGSALKDLFVYEIYRGTSSNPTVKVGRVAGEIFTDGGLSDNTTYYYRVKAVDFTGNPSSYSNQDDATTNPTLQDGASVLVVYADDAIGTNQSLSAGSRQYIQYYEYVGTAPSLPVSGTFVKFIGADGQSVWPIYATSAAGANQSFSPTGKDFVTFYESLTQPTLPVSGQTFVPYVGADGANGSPATGGVLPAYPNLQSYTVTVVDTDNEYALSASTSGDSSTSNLQAVRKLKAGYSSSVSLKDKSLAQIQEDDFVTITESVTGAKASFKITSIIRRANYTNNGVSGQYYYDISLNFVEGNGVTTDISYASGGSNFVCDFSRSFTRAAGRWNIGVSSLPSTSSGANTDFVNAIGAPVDRDQAWFYTGTAANPTSQGVWLYDASTPVWIEQDEVIDGNLLVTGTVTANAINADAITGKNVTVGNLTATTVPTGTQEGARIQQDGTMFVGNREEYLRWDGSLLTVNGEIRNIDERIFRGRKGYWERVTSTGSVTAAMNRLGGAGLFVFIMCGGGGSGARGNTTTRSQTGGGAGGFARVAYEWNGSTAISFAAGSGGASHTGSTEVDGFNGSSSVLTVGGVTAITCTGGTKGLTHANGGAGGTGGTGTINNTSFFTETRTSTGGAGGFTSDDYRQGTGGGGINVFQKSGSNDGGNITSTGTSAAMATAGGGPFGSPANNSNAANPYTGYLDEDGFLALAPTQSLFVTLRDDAPFTPSNGAYSGTGDATSANSGEFSGSGAAVAGTTDDNGSSGNAGYGGGSGAAHSDGGRNASVGSGGNGVLYIGRI